MIKSFTFGNYEILYNLENGLPVNPRVQFWAGNVPISLNSVKHIEALLEAWRAEQQRITVPIEKLVFRIVKNLSESADVEGNVFGLSGLKIVPVSKCGKNETFWIFTNEGHAFVTEWEYGEDGKSKIYYFEPLNGFKNITAYDAFDYFEKKWPGNAD